MSWLAIILIVWPLAWALNVAMVRSAFGNTRTVSLLVPLIFGATLLLLWEGLVRHFQIMPVILPAPSDVWQTFLASRATLWGDFQQTVLKGALSGFAIGSLAAFLAAILIDRSNFLTRGLLPIGNFVAALPIVGIAPILVSWFGFDWQSKAAVVVVMVFFPMLVNCVQGLRETDAMQRDLMRTYAASYGQTMWRLRLPAAMPFIFNGLKISATLALIGAVVAEYFGSPTQGMGFRISTGVGSLSIDLVWAEIMVAALAGTALYGVVAWIERRLCFWHPSHRK
ncbi:ABC transporter permease [Pseudoroseicyclus sp. H15]